ncbi:MAG: hypothetical protein H6702_12075 [Myxococcales bacterium]|nr:hypothetical protein [Myxococcales bacterium]
MFSTALWRLPLLICLLALTAGCGQGDDWSGDGEDGGTPEWDGAVPVTAPDAAPPEGGSFFDEPESPSRGCTRDPARVAAMEACAVDADCPCGTACLLGRCEAECLADAECGPSEWCDDRGQCAETLPVRRAPPPPGGGEGGLHLEE